jgi:CheY-like chemotaxis protein
MTKTILIIDDEEDVRAILSMGLELSEGWQVLSAASGLEGIGIALQTKPDVILVDLMMPHLDGCATFVQLKSYPELQGIPVILMTAKDEQTLNSEQKNLQFAGILTKPFRPFELGTIIEDILSNL